jgi:hypothetical protein
VESYVDFTSGLKSPERYRRWAAICAVASALQRKVNIRIEGQYQFANLYTLLVGPPGLGKGNAVKPMQRMLRKLGTIHLSPRGLTKRAFYTEMEACEHSDVDPVSNSIEVHSSLTAIIEEFGVFLLPRDIEFMDALADVYDNPEVFSYKTQHSGENEVKYPNFNLLACSTPRGIRERFTDDIFEQGFPARIIMIFSDEQVRVPLFKERPKLDEMEMDLVHDLEQIACIKGTYRWSTDAQVNLDAWYANRMPPVPSDSRLAHYNARRLAHITKLSMVMCASRTDELIIAPQDLGNARLALLEAETAMGGALSAIGANPLKAQIAAARKLVELHWQREHKPMTEHKLLQFLYNEVPVNYVNPCIQGMLDAAWIRVTGGEAPNRTFMPVELPGDKVRDTDRHGAGEEAGGSSKGAVK